MQASGLGHRDLLDVHVEGARHRCATLELFQPLACECERNRADATEAGGDTGLRLEIGIEFGAVAGEPGHVGGGPQLADEACSMPGGTACELLALEQHDIAPAELRQVIGDRATDNTATDDDSLCPSWQLAHVRPVHP